MNHNRHRYYRVMFYSGALFNCSAAILWLLGFEQMYVFMGGEDVPQAPLFTVFVQLTSMLIILFGGIYYSIGRNPDCVSGRALAIAGLVGKLIFVFVFVSYAIAGITPWMLAGLVTGDLLYAALFLEYINHQSKNISIN